MNRQDAGVARMPKEPALSAPGVPRVLAVSLLLASMLVSAGCEPPAPKSGVMPFASQRSMVAAEDRSDASDAPAPAAPPAPVVLTARAFPLGTKIESTTRVGTEVLLTADSRNGRPITVEDYGTLTDRRTVEILGFRAHALRKIRVSFQERSSSHIVNGRQKNTVSPVSGKTYVLEARDQGLAILDDQERDVTHAEGVALSQLFRTLGAPDEMARAIPKAPMAQGQSVPALAEALKRDLEHAAEGRVWFGKVSVTPTGTREAAGTDCVVLGIVLQVGLEIEGRSVQMDTKGEMLLRSDNAWPITMDLAGPVSVDFTEKGVRIHGEGKSRLTESYAYP